ncbi:DUF2922 domain-containing protein [Niallia sp. 01092]|uniref:DUF2922 domain-containing protein n=1 Tax=unclassified Niallia TaxID=2837522 RepID=UPI003FD618B9
MAKTLELTFLTGNGKTSKISLDGPVEPINTEQVLSAMQTIIAANIFANENGELVAAKGIRLLERNVTDYEI